MRGEGFEGSVELEEGIVPAGFSAVPIVTGLSDDSVVEIREGVPEDTEVFTAYITESANSWENSGIMFG